ncbi:MerR family transcriptional regulator [Rufibacter immobilis]|uniref:MerR family transcriptional regulator n=1 Tax=Rufibacter immobilis TaxID=1348778 RepID=UPI0035EFE407
MKGRYVALDIPVYDDDPGDYADEILENLRYKQFSLKAAGISSRVYNNWRSQGIVPNVEEDGKRTYFDFIQYLWIQIVKDLRKFGLPLGAIASVKDYLFDEDFMAKIELSDWDRDELKKGFEKAHGRPMTGEELKDIEERLKLGNTFLPYRFTLIVLVHFQHRSDTNIYIFAEGGVAVWSDLDQIHQPENKPDLSAPHINLPLGHYFAQFLSDETKAEFLPKVPILTREEQEVLRAMRNDEVKELTIKFSKKGSKRRADLITKVDKQLSDKQKKDIAQILGTRDYSTITMKTQNGTQLTFEEAQRTRL